MNPLQPLLNPKLENKAPFSAQVTCSESGAQTYASQNLLSRTRKEQAGPGPGSLQFASGFALRKLSHPQKRFLNPR